MAPRVLYIEDNLDNLILVRRLMAAEGIELLEAVTGRDGLAMAQENQPDLILVDINMPDLDGLIVTEKLREMSHLDKVPIVALTANIMRDVLERAMKVGCDGYIPKPIQVDEFPETIYGYLKNGRRG